MEFIFAVQFPRKLFFEEATFDLPLNVADFIFAI